MHMAAPEVPSSPLDFLSRIHSSAYSLPWSTSNTQVVFFTHLTLHLVRFFCADPQTFRLPSLQMFTLKHF